MNSFVPFLEFPGVTRSTISSGRVRSAARRGLMGLGGVDDYKSDSSATIQAKIVGFKQQLANAQAERNKCQVGVTTILLPWEMVAHAECVLRWDGQIGWFKDRISEASVALGQAQQREKVAAAEEAQALKDATLPAGVPGAKGTSSKGQAMTGAGGIPTWAKALGGAVLLGGVAFILVKATKK